MKFIYILISLIIIGWILKRKHNKIYTTEILITRPFDTLKVGKIAIFKSGSKVDVGDFVLISLPGYEIIWKVIVKKNGKLELKNRIGETLPDFPSCHIWGKMIGYKGELDNVKSISNQENNKENTI